MTPEQMRAFTDEEAVDFIAKKGMVIEDWENNYVVAEVQNRVIALARRALTTTERKMKWIGYFKEQKHLLPPSLLALCR
jgi:hypothetical protein